MSKKIKNNDVEKIKAEKDKIVKSQKVVKK